MPEIDLASISGLMAIYVVIAYLVHKSGKNGWYWPIYCVILIAKHPRC